MKLVIEEIGGNKFEITAKFGAQKLLNRRTLTFTTEGELFSVHIFAPVLTVLWNSEI